MTESTHTSGPWGVNELAAGNPDCYLTGNDGRKVEIGYIVQFESMPIAATIKNRADACLIATAPDMLAALEKLTTAADDFAEHGKQRHFEALEIAIANARDVIAKAKGQG